MQDDIRTTTALERERAELERRIRTTLAEEQAEHLRRVLRAAKSPFRRQPGRYVESPYLASLIERWRVCAS